MKSITASATKYQTNASAAQTYYTTAMGQLNPQAWESATAAAATTWEQGVQQAVANKSFQAGINGKGAKLVARAQAVGGQRYAQGVQQAGPAWQTGFQQYANVIQATLAQLGPRAPRGDPRNQQRAAAMATALHQARANKSAA